MTDTSKETVVLLALTLDTRSPNNTHFDQKRAASTLFSLCAERDETKAEIERLREYAQHKRSCDLMGAFIDGKFCTCGFSAKMKGTSDDQ